MRAFSEAARASGVAWLMRRAIAQATLIGVFAYAYLTLFGLIHDVALEVKTGIDPFAFYGVEDFFLAGARHPGGVLLALAAPVAMLLMGYLAMLFAWTYFRLTQPIMARYMGSAGADEWARKMFEFFGFAFGGFCLVAAAAMLVLYLAVIPFVSAAGLSDDCAPPRTVTFKPQGDKPGRKESVQIFSGNEKIAFVRLVESGAYAAIRLEETESVSTETPARGLSWYCPLTN